MSTATLRFDDGANARTIDVCIVPYNTSARVVDRDSEPYLEQFHPGAFRDQVEEAQSTALRIWLDLEHRRGTIGHAVRLLDLPGGLHGSFQVHDGAEGDEALGLVREDVLTGVSMQATPIRSRTVDSVTHRLRAHLNRVSLCRAPVYADARVLGIRRGRRDDQPPPASPLDVQLWDLERLDRKLRAMASRYLDEYCDQKQLGRRLFGLGLRPTPPRSYRHDPRYQRVLRLQAQIKEQRAELERRLRPQPAPDMEPAVLAEALRPKVLRRVVCGPITVR